MEMKSALGGLSLDFVTPMDLGINESPPEEGSTFEDNALHKARFFFDRSRLPTIADDSGIAVEALKNELGLNTRRWGAGPAATDDEWIALFLKRMEKENNRRAHFHCSIAYIDAMGTPHVFEGDCLGIITPSLEAPYLPGLPISACFKPEGCDKVFSALSIDEKNCVSHRGRALGNLRKFLSLHLT